MYDEEKGTVQEEQPPSYEATSSEPPQYSSDPPPTYDSVVGKIANIRENSADNKDLAKNLCAFVFCGTIATIIFIVLSIGIPIANITIGAIYIDDCARERMIPIYLVVSGCFLLVRAFLSISEQCHKRNSGQTDEEYERPKLFQCCDGPIGCFLFAWFIAGNVWIFRIRGKYQSEDSELPGYCNETLYLYAFWITVASYIAVAAMIVLTCTVTCIACCCAAGKAAANK